jgi:hypothetical protein
MWLTMAWSLDVLAGVSTSGWRGARAPAARHPDQLSDHAGGENGEGGKTQPLDQLWSSFSTLMASTGASPTGGDGHA